MFLTLLRAARSKARYAALLTVQGGAAIGRVALAEPGVDVGAIANVLIPLDVVSPFRSVVNNQQPHIGSLISSDPGIDAMMLRLGGTMPPSALILPIVLRDRVVAIVVAHRVHSDLKLVDVTELLPLGARRRRCARPADRQAQGRRLSRARGRDRGAERADRSERCRYQARRARRRGRSRGARRRRAEQPPLPSFERRRRGLDHDRAAEADRRACSIGSRRAKEGDAEDELNEAVERASEALGALMRRFPGKLRVDRFSVAGRPLRAAQYGGLLELVVRLGSVAVRAVDRQDERSAARRPVLRDGLHRRAPAAQRGVRARRAPVRSGLRRARDRDRGAVRLSAARSRRNRSRACAAPCTRPIPRSSPPRRAAIVALGDIDAIGDLIGAIERADRAGDHMRKALIALTAQDFGPSEKQVAQVVRGRAPPPSHRVADRRPRRTRKTRSARPRSAICAGSPASTSATTTICRARIATPRPSAGRSGGARPACAGSCCPRKTSACGRPACCRRAATANSQPTIAVTSRMPSSTTGCPSRSIKLGFAMHQFATQRCARL